MTVNGSMPKAQTWIGATCASSGKGAYPKALGVKLCACLKRHAMQLEFLNIFTDLDFDSINNINISA